MQNKHTDIFNRSVFVLSADSNSISSIETINKEMRINAGNHFLCVFYLLFNVTTDVLSEN